jgi:hypothetical protein
VSAHVDVHRGVGLGELRRERDPLRGQGRYRGPRQRQARHASSFLKTSVYESHRITNRDATLLTNCDDNNNPPARLRGDSDHFHVCLVECLAEELLSPL